MYIINPHDPCFAASSAEEQLVSTDRRYAKGAKKRLKIIDEIMAGRPCNRREKMHFQALKIWLGGDLWKVSKALDELLEEFPTDIRALWMGHQIDFYLGDSKNIRDRIASCIPYWDPEHP